VIKSALNSQIAALDPLMSYRQEVYHRSLAIQYLA